MNHLNELNRLEGGNDGRAVFPESTEVGALSAGEQELQRKDESIAPARFKVKRKRLGKEKQKCNY